VPGLRVLIGAGLVGAAIFGVVPVVVAAHARDVRQSAAAVGLLLTLWSAGSIAGGLWYGSRSWRTPANRQFPWAMAAVALGLLPIGLARSTGEMALFLVLGGLALAVVESLELRLIASLTPEGAATEAFGWFNTASYLGFAAGSALAGLVVDQLGVHLTGLIPAALALVAVGVVLAWRRHLYGR
jgi:predicted MFS family arabinose efflux permease